MAEISSDDIRAAVAAGAIDESQAASVMALAQERHGFRAHMSDDDEPFELFRGFAEIFVTVGLSLVTAGVVGLSLVTSNPVFLPIVSAVVSVLLSLYFTRRRRMALPSIFLAATFGFSAFMTFVLWSTASNSTSPALWLGVFVATGVALLGYFRAFRTPFTLFLVGAAGVGAAFSLAALFSPAVFAAERRFDGFDSLFDLGESPLMAMTLLVFGLIAFVGAMSFDLRDPFRVSRHAASAFWLHILAAPAIVNVVGVSLLAVGGAAGYGLAALAILAITLVALVIDRRSFLTAAIIYVGVILGWALSSTHLDPEWGYVWTLLLLGAFITALGAFWIEMRGALMRTLPAFPGKTRLPPYQDLS